MRLGSVLLVIFLVLKLTNLIAWSWLWVLSPLWIPISLLAILLLIAVAIFGKKGIEAVKEGIRQGLEE